MSHFDTHLELIDQLLGFDMSACQESIMYILQCHGEWVVEEIGIRPVTYSDLPHH